MKQFLLPNQERARLVIIMMGLFVVLNIFDIIFLYIELDAVRNTTQDVEMLVTIRVAYIYLRLFLLILAAVFFVRWMDYAHQNFERAGGNSVFPRVSVLWAFFIPLVNLARPYRVVNEFWQGMQNLIYARSQKLPDYQNYLIGLWWTCWVGINVSTFISLQVISIGNITISSLATKTYIDIFGDMLELAAAIFVILFIRKYTQFEDEMGQYLRIEDLEGVSEEEYIDN